MQICVHVEAHDQVNEAAIPGPKQARRRRNRSAPISTAITAKCALVAFAESVPVFVERTPGYRRVAEITMTVNIRPPTSRHIVPGSFQSIMESAF